MSYYSHAAHGYDIGRPTGDTEMKLRPHQRVTYELAKERVLAVLNKRIPLNAASVGAQIWPDNDMKAQGLGAAASRIMKRMEREDGSVRWVCRDDGLVQVWGWVKTKSSSVPLLGPSASDAKAQETTNPVESNT